MDNIFSVVQRSKSAVRTLNFASESLSSDLPGVWTRGWRDFVASQVGRSVPSGDVESYTSPELAVSILEELRATSRNEMWHGHGHLGIDGPSDAGAYGFGRFGNSVEIYQDLESNEAGFRRLMDGRGKLWADFERLDWEKRWSRAMFCNSPSPPLPHLDEQIVLRAEMRMLDMDLSVMEVCIRDLLVTH